MVEEGEREEGIGGGKRRGSRRECNGVSWAVPRYEMAIRCSKCLAELI